MYEDEEDEEVRDPDLDLPKFKIRHSDIKIEALKLVVRSKIHVLLQRPHSSSKLKSKNLTDLWKKMYACPWLNT
jgi:hypothetical protein